MYGIISTLQLHEAIQGEDEFKTYVRDASLTYMELLREMGVLDLMVIRTGQDTMVSVAIFESASAAVLAMAQSKEIRREGPEVTVLLSRVAGDVNDLPAGFMLDGYVRGEESGDEPRRY